MPPQGQRKRTADDSLGIGHSRSKDYNCVIAGMDCDEMRWALLSLQLVAEMMPRKLWFIVSFKDDLCQLRCDSYFWAKIGDIIIAQLEVTAGKEFIIHFQILR